MKNWWSWLIVGALLIVGGVMALANPFAASLAVELLVGWTFLIAGIALLYAAWTVPAATGGRIWLGIWGLLVFIVGVSLVADPFSGLITLTFLLGLSFAFSGVLRLIVAWRLKQSPLFWIMLLSGALSTLIGFAVLANFQGAAVSLLGFLLAIELLSNGAGAISYGLIQRNRD